MTTLRAILLTSLSILGAVGCKQPEPIPEKLIQVQVTATPGKAIVYIAGRALGEAPQNLTVKSADELLEMTATMENEPVVEKRIRFLSLDRAEVSFIFGTNNSAMAQALGLAKILVFDYGAGVTFEVNRSELKPEFLPLLERQAALLKTHFPDMDILVCGHTDSVGTPEHNLSLSLDRARAVADDLGLKGVPKDRMKIQGFGLTYPLADNNTEEGRALNRRTEVILPL